MSKTVISKARVLIVDDEAANVRLLERMLELVGALEVRSTLDPRETVALFDALQPDLVLLDLHMPHLDGFAVLELLKTRIGRENPVPIIVLTADVTGEARRRALAAGARDFLTKPLDHNEVLLRIKNLLEMRFLHAELQRHNATLEQRVAERTSQLEEALRTLRETQQQVIRNERLHALGQMAAGIAHDFNNALTMILGFSELVLTRMQEKGDEQTTEELNIIAMAAQDAARTVSRLREFYRKSENETRLALDVNELVRNAVSLTSPRWKDQSVAEGRPIEVRTDLGAVPQIAGDPAELREALANLIFNAIDAMPTGGEIVVRTQFDGANVVLAVRDTGAGMTEEVRQRCLEPFFTSKGDRGTGLGLAETWGIVQRHGGTIEIESELGAGSTFTLRLPKLEGTLATGSETAHEVLRTLRVLVADDQPMVCELMVDAMLRDGHAVETAADGVEALALIERTPFDLLITDHAMPRMTGEQLAAAAKALQPAIRVIIVTGFGDMIHARGGSPGVDLVLGKPLPSTDLRRAVATVMRKPDDAREEVLKVGTEPARGTFLANDLATTL